jgi:TetR/AcrR family transcriptional regulator
MANRTLEEPLALEDTEAPAAGRRRRNRGSEVVRGKLINAAVTEFAASGYEGASPRRIAEAADAHQSQIKYHFDTKDELWRRCLDLLIDELDRSIAAQPGFDSDNPRVVMEASIRGLVHFAATWPELNRIMMHEATSPSERLTWLVDTAVRDRRNALDALWVQLADAGDAAPIPADLVYHTLIGAASLIYANAPEAELMGIAPSSSDLVERHADALVALFLR